MLNSGSVQIPWNKCVDRERSGTSRWLGNQAQEGEDGSRRMYSNILGRSKLFIVFSVESNSPRADFDYNANYIFPPLLQDPKTNPCSEDDKAPKSSQSDVKGKSPNGAEKKTAPKIKGSASKSKTSASGSGSKTGTNSVNEFRLPLDIPSSKSKEQLEKPTAEVKANLERKLEEEKDHRRRHKSGGDARGRGA